MGAAPADGALLPAGGAGIATAGEAADRRGQVLVVLLLAAFAATVPWENVLIVEGVGTLGRISGILAMSAGLAWVLHVGKPLRRHQTAHVAMGLFVLWGALSILWSIAPMVTATRFTSNLQLLALIWLLWALTDREVYVHAVLQGYVLGCGAIAANLLAQLLANPTTLVSRLTTEGSNPNALAFAVLLSVAVAAYLAASRFGGRWGLVGNLLYVPIAAETLVLCGSRGATVAAVGLVFILLAILRGLNARQRSVALLIALLLLVGLVRLAPVRVIERLASTSQALATGDLSERQVVWKAGFRQFTARPLCGVGAGAFRNSLASVFFGRDWAPHNGYVSVGVEQGVIGLALFLILLLSLFTAANRMPRLSRGLWLSILSIWCVDSMVGAWEYRKVSWLFFGLLVSHSLVRERLVASRSGGPPAEPDDAPAAGSPEGPSPAPD